MNSAQVILLLLFRIRRVSFGTSSASAYSVITNTTATFAVATNTSYYTTTTNTLMIIG